MRICFGRKRKTLRSSFCMSYTLKTLEAGERVSSSKTKRTCLKPGKRSGQVVCIGVAASDSS